jgi:hypothetical protein
MLAADAIAMFASSPLHTPSAVLGYHRKLLLQKLS